METFYLGTNEPSWLKKYDIPLFVSNTRFRRLKYPKPAIGRWCLDSGGFSVLSRFGEWIFSRLDYLKDIERYVQNVGNLDWVAPMDYMCEESVLRKTGLTVEEHQRRTIDNFLFLRHHVGDLVIPVLQGWTLDEYLSHIDQYQQAGINLEDESVVGLGSICRRNQREPIKKIITRVADANIKLHTFGLSGYALKDNHKIIKSSDSMSWSYQASKYPPLPGHNHKCCNFCIEYALMWRERLLNRCID